MKHPIFDNTFFDMARVGARGQIVIPARVRRQIKVKPGDQVVLISGVKNFGAVIINAEHISQHMNKMRQSMEKLERRIMQKGKR